MSDKTRGIIIGSLSTMAMTVVSAFGVLAFMNHED